MERPLDHNQELIFQFGESVFSKEAGDEGLSARASVVLTDGNGALHVLISRSVVTDTTTLQVERDGKKLDLGTVVNDAMLKTADSHSCVSLLRAFSLESGVAVEEIDLSKYPIALPESLPLLDVGLLDRGDTTDLTGYVSNECVDEWFLSDDGQEQIKFSGLIRITRSSDQQEFATPSDIGKLVRTRGNRLVGVLVGICADASYVVPLASILNEWRTNENLDIGLATQSDITSYNSGLQLSATAPTGSNPALSESVYAEDSFGYETLIDDVHSTITEYDILKVMSEPDVLLQDTTLRSYGIEGTFRANEHEVMTKLKRLMLSDGTLAIDYVEAYEVLCQFEREAS